MIASVLKFDKIQPHKRLKKKKKKLFKSVIMTKQSLRMSEQLLVRLIKINKTGLGKCHVLTHL